jgi:hypothetical protein
MWSRRGLKGLPFKLLSFNDIQTGKAVTVGGKLGRDYLIVFPSCGKKEKKRLYYYHYYYYYYSIRSFRVNSIDPGFIGIYFSNILIKI